MTLKMTYLHHRSRRITTRLGVLVGYAVKCVPCKSWSPVLPTGRHPVPTPRFKKPVEVLKWFEQNS